MERGAHNIDPIKLRHVIDYFHKPSRIVLRQIHVIDNWEEYTYNLSYMENGTE